MAEQIRSLVDARLETTLEQLTALARIPSVSWPSFDQTRVQASADAVAAHLRALDFFESVEIVREPTDAGDLGQPAVIARREPRHGAPTVLLYAHHDVQPPGDLAVWESEPFEPVRRGDRLFGRGVADDKAGIVVHLESLRLLGELVPESDLGVVVFIEGEEEYGSPSFSNTLAAHRDSLASDVIIVADSGNWTTEIPALTVSLRGNATVKVTVRTLDHALHSGMFGGVVPDAMLVLTKLLGRLHDDEGNVLVPGLDAREHPTPEFSEERLRDESGLLPGVAPIGEGDFLARLWNHPAISVIGLDMPATSEASNTLIPSVSAMVSLRVAPGQNAAEAARALTDFLCAEPPFGAEVSCEIKGTGAAFAMNAASPVVDLARDAMTSVWGVEPVDMGVGGSIPFIAEFVEAFPGATVLVTGVEDPDSRAHSPNESLHIPSFAKGIASQTHFLRALSEHRS